jgi:hypothetical protein
MKSWKALLGAANLSLFLFTGSAGAAVVYSSMPSPYPDNLPSLGYEATSTQEFGDQIQFAGTGRALTTVTVALSDWAKSSDWISQYPTGSYSQQLTLNLYNVGASNTVGSLIASLTTTAQVPLRPDNWTANGILFNATFNGLGVTLPNQIIYGLAFNTTDHGYQPTGVAGPYDSLNFGLNTVAPSVGTDASPDTVFWNTSYAGFYSDGGAGGIGTFRSDSGWSSPYYTPAIEFEVLDQEPVPEPCTMLLFGAGSLGLAFFGKRRKNA